MKAALNERYGPPDVISIRDVPTPKPGKGEILVRVYATTVNRTDACALRAHPFFVRLSSGLLRPKNRILGLDFAGVVEQVGTGVTRFSPGERVFGLTPNGNGGHAEYVCLPEDGALANLPDNVDFREAVVCEGAWYANAYLQRFNLQRNQNILIYGASGAIGCAAVQLAKIYGARVTAVVSSVNVRLAKRLGADRVVDYTAEDFTRIEDTFDFVLDAVGKTTYFRCRPLLKSTGVFSATDLGPWWQNILLALWSSLRGSGRVVFPALRSSQSFIEFLREHLASGEFRAVIDRSYPLEEIIDAYRYVDTEQKTGIVVIEIVPEEIFTKT